MKTDLTQAKRLINECLETKSSYLDLGNCGITNLGDLPELFECTHLETLILSDRWTGSYLYSASNNKDEGKENNLKNIPEEIEKLSNLKTLIIGGGGNNKIWHI